MDDRLTQAETLLRELEQSLRGIEHRLAVIEGRLPASLRDSLSLAAVSADSTRTDQTHGAGLFSSPVGGYDVVTLLSFVGRTFVALGGAYLLRALTDSSIVPQQAGIALGLAYAAFWLVMADRAGAAGASLSSAFHALVASIIAFPLLWEAVTRFRFLRPETSAAAIALATSLLLLVAVRRRLQTIAWISVLFALATALALVSTTAVVLPFAIVALLVGVATLWLGYTLEWVYLRWPVAIVADTMVVALAARVSSRSWPDPPGQVIAVQLSLLTGYLVSIVIRTLFRGRDVNPFEVVQGVAALAVGFGGAVYVAQATGLGVTAFAAINLICGIGCYAAALVFVGRRHGLRRNFYFYSTLALVLVLVSIGLLLRAGALPLTWAALGVLASWLASKIGRAALSLHAAVYVIAAASVSGLFGAAADALVGSAADQWGPFPFTAIVVITAVAACWVIPVSRVVASPGADWHLPRLLIAIILIWSLGGWLVAILTPLLAGGPGHGADPGMVATIRTSVLAFAALGTAWAGRYDRFCESALLLYPVLVGGGIKLLIEDLPRSKPATLFVALVLYGAALIVAPKLARGRALATMARRADGRRLR